ncbi:MAG TPA: hypothetical protein DHV48_10765 [Prolixibacteraceae bacterium]|nr:hypothetical protein [Prolixibacteraceae bacterium]
MSLDFRLAAELEKMLTKRFFMNMEMMLEAVIPYEEYIIRHQTCLIHLNKCWMNWQHEKIVSQTQRFFR